MKAKVTRTSDTKFPAQPQEMDFNTLEELRDFILSVKHGVIIFASTDEPDTLDVEIYDNYRE